MKRALSKILMAACFAVVTTISCTHKPPLAIPADGNLPPDVAAILVGKCAIAGCHNAASYQNSAGLLMDSWEHILQGSSNGAAIVAYSPRFSPLLYFVNTDASLGTVATPTMPQSTTSNPQAPLTKAEYMTLYNWIANGAPDKNGNIPFAANADTRQKIYLTQQGCDLLAVIDAQSRLVMRYIPIGADSTKTESPHCVRTSSDGRYAYVSFINGNYVQKIDTRTDQVVGTVNLGSLLPGGTGGSWNIVYVSPFDSTIVATDWVANGYVVYTNTNSMQAIPSYTGSGSSFVFPHGITSNATFDTTFITAQYGNVVYRYVQGTHKYKQICIKGTDPFTSSPTDSASPNPHEIIMSPDYSRFFVTCQGTNEVRVLDAFTYQVLDSIQVGTFPQEMAISTKYPYLFVTCQEDAATTHAGSKGSVYVIDYNTFEIKKILYGDFYQPHGITVDDVNNKVFIASTNANPNGPAPHHATYCGGRAGWYTIYDLFSLAPADNKRYEVTVLPYSAATRFKQ